MQTRVTFVHWEGFWFVVTRMCLVTMHVENTYHLNSCSNAVHTHCANLAMIPTGDWSCTTCIKQGKAKSNNTAVKNETDKSLVKNTDNASLVDAHLPIASSPIGKTMFKIDTMMSAQQQLADACDDDSMEDNDDTLVLPTNQSDAMFDMDEPLHSVTTTIVDDESSHFFFRPEKLPPEPPFRCLSTARRHIMNSTNFVQRILERKYWKMLASGEQEREFVAYKQLVKKRVDTTIQQDVNMVKLLQKSGKENQASFASNNRQRKRTSLQRCSPVKNNLVQQHHAATLLC